MDQVLEVHSRPYGLPHYARECGLPCPCALLKSDTQAKRETWAQAADLVAGHTQGAQVVQLAHAAARVDGNDVVGMPCVALQHLHQQSVFKLMHLMPLAKLVCRFPAASSNCETCYRCIQTKLLHPCKGSICAFCKQHIM